MNLIERIQNSLDDMTPGERMAGEYVIQYPFDVLRYGSSDIAAIAGTSRSNVVRFCKKLGFKGYSEFRYELSYYLRNAPQQAAADAANDTVDSNTVLHKYLNCFEQMNSFYQSSQLQQAADQINRAKRILVLGRYHSSYSAQQMAFRLNRSRIIAYFPSDLSMVDAYCDTADEGDVILVFSIQGRKEFYYDTLQEFRKHGSHILLITMNSNAQIAPLADQVFVLPCMTRQYPLEILDDAPTFYLFIELLMEAINQTNGGPENKNGGKPE